MDDKENKKTVEKDTNQDKHQSTVKPQKPKEVVSSTYANEKMGWYYKPNKEHQLPEVNNRGKESLAKYRGIYHGDISGKNLYLTFDEGYENGYTSKILDTLRDANVKVTFFITGDYLRRNPELVKRMVREGHIVGNHTDNHPSLPTVSDATLQKEINSLSDAFTKETGATMQYLRPPMGEYSERTLKLTYEMGYRNVFWSVAMVDWRPDAGTPEQNKNTVKERLHNGAVILLHAVNKANADMLGSLIQECRDEGYRFCGLEEIQ
ncbi:polysaccharide deacetylase [Desulforamulus reducens MI-1]|uniref:Polysaccharide deacetylase n=2 Tax=Desulforamulus TaxID=2916693 RepID=A4J5X8_DESRM|nr:polysaccharide deacetylase [Desulforamulus reducens MI-1]